MNEALLQHIWQHKILLNKKLFTVCGKPLTILQTGQPNQHAGPDFLNAKVKIDQTIWAGNIEVHIQSSSWFNHNHHKDPAYKNVVLHVVYVHDKPIQDAFGNEIPTLELKNWLPPHTLSRYNALLEVKHAIACEPIFELPDDIKTNLFLNRLLIERFEHKSTAIYHLLEKNNNHWEDTFYQLLARYFGQKINEHAFARLATLLPLDVLAKHKQQLMQLQCLFLGVAGFLDAKPSGNYHYSLQKEFAFLKHKYNLINMHVGEWRFAKTRPANFPTVRLLQMAVLINQSTHLLSKVFDCKKVTDVCKLFQIKTEQVFPYRLLVPKSNNTEVTGINSGKTFTNNIIINVVIPIMFNYGKHKNKPDLVNRALNWIEELPAESNSIISAYKKLGLTAVNAAQSQALLTLNKSYCTTKKCLHCAIGNHVLFK
jgi:hypothetical protein